MEAAARRPSRKLVIALALAAVLLLAVPILLVIGASLWLSARVTPGRQTVVATTYAAEGDAPLGRSVRVEDVPAGTREEWHEIPGPDGTWVKDGPSVRWGSDGTKLEEGAFLDGERDGPWIFRFENGVVDPQRSGIYHEGERVEPLPGPVF